MEPVDSAALDSLQPVLTWRAQDPAVWYVEVQVSKDPAFSNGPGSPPLYWELRHGGVTNPPNSYAIPAARPLEPGAIYYWRVRPRIQGGGDPMPWSPANRFTT